MDKKCVLVSAGPIPAKLDSVKYLTNRFKGKSILEVARRLQLLGHHVNLIVWRYSDLIKSDTLSKMIDNGSKIYTVEDVYDYYSKMKALAKQYQALILGAAVANLTPVETIEGKFPSHLYSVGEEFSIKFTIAPRIIDMIKERNHRCCLIGYKLYDGMHEELISAAQKTLKDSRANAIFANRPNDIGTKYLVLPEGGVFEMDFQTHIQWINRLITAKHFQSIETQPEINNVEYYRNRIGILLCKHFEDHIRVGEYGSCAVRGNNYIITTARKHNGISFIPIFALDGNLYNREIKYKGDKPSKNAPLLCAELITYDHDIIHHRHIRLEGLPTVEFTLPGTTEERNSKLNEDYYIEQHGTIEKKKILPVDWDRYYEMFPERYFKIHPNIKRLYDNPFGLKILDVGSNTNVNCDFWLDPHIESDRPGRVTYETLKKYDIITLNNSINYLTEEEIKSLTNALNPEGLIIANTFASAPVTRVCKREIVHATDDTVTHILWDEETRQYYRHTFFNRTPKFWRKLGFSTEEYNGGKSLLLRYNKKKEGRVLLNDKRYKND